MVALVRYSSPPSHLHLPSPPLCPFFPTFLRPHLYSPSPHLSPSFPPPGTGSLIVDDGGDEDDEDDDNRGGGGSC